MSKEPSRVLFYLIPLLILVVLVGFFLLGSPQQEILQPGASLNNGTKESGQTDNAKPEIWLPRDNRFVWGNEIPRPIDQLPGRILEFTGRYSPRYVVASLSCGEITSYREIADVSGELKKAGFRGIVFHAHVKPPPGCPD